MKEATKIIKKQSPVYQDTKHYVELLGWESLLAMTYVKDILMSQLVHPFEHIKRAN